MVMALGSGIQAFVMHFNSDPHLYKGRWMAILGIVAGVMMVLVACYLALGMNLR